MKRLPPILMLPTLCYTLSSYLSHTITLFSAKVACASPQLAYTPKRFTAIDFAAFAERIFANWLSPTRSQPFSHTSQEGEFARPRTPPLSC
ncbi:hypothetical protein T440DRAFT_473695 [Plenodomus tracheiphilus IPT5]|uniref:Uncharacterized protein n=1 Tax=Plenodomus tracheiphilus IPT5 TaxID=1408161 RepID=A0A6A7ALS8_9PLEO|nr:hypothetical protein T440DRAFT_473695 [Plenodomus tracheiphilus IPT5]